MLTKAKRLKFELKALVSVVLFFLLKQHLDRGPGHIIGDRYFRGGRQPPPSRRASDMYMWVPVHMNVYGSQRFICGVGLLFLETKSLTEFGAH